MSICDCNQGRLPCSCKNPLTGDGDDTIQFQLDAAQSELAALREDLDECDGERHRLRDKLNSVEQRLTAAERRNAAINIEAAAKMLAACMDYPWEHMPEQGRASMREHAKAVINAAAKELNQ